MTLLTYRINIEDAQKRRYCIQYLYQKSLKDDPHWHFFLDENGITLRTSKSFIKKIEKLLKNYPFQKKDDYTPSLDEYPGVKFVGDDFLPLFHSISVLSVKYPAFVMNKCVLERAAHTIVNQSGLFNFEGEAWIYAQMAINRAILGGKFGRHDD